MRNPFDQLAKRIVERALAPAGPVLIQHEIAPDTRAADIWFEPDPAREAVLRERGLFGRLMSRPSLLEPFHGTPDLDDMRACVHKQLSLDQTRLAKARREKRSRPPFPHLWVPSTGRPVGVFEAYGFTPMPGFPPGCWGRREADAVGIVVLRELPRDRDTLFLRLMAADEVLAEAIVELLGLPEDAWEREAALSELIALRVRMPQDPNEKEKEYLMTTSDLEYWKDRFREEGRQAGLAQAIIGVYRARFGELADEVAEAIAAMDDPAKLERCLTLISTGSRDEVAAALRTAGAR